MSLFAELNRRNVFRVGIAYVVLSWLLLQIGDVVFDFLEVPVWAGKLLLALLALGFVPVLIFSWAYELTPEGVRKESEVDRSRSITRATGRKLDLMTMALVLAGIGFLLLDRFFFEGSDRPGSASDGVRAEFPAEIGSDPGPESGMTPAAPGPPENSIAVLPFVNMSPDQDNEYFSDGISEELLNLLAKVPHFQVTGRTSSFAFKGQNQDLRAIGEKLRVRNILEGSVRKAGNKVRITAQLVEVQSGYHLWSNAFDRELDDIFAIQDEIARAVVAALRQTLLGEIRSTAPTNSTEAHELVLKGRYQWHQRTPESLARAVRYFEQAIAADPNYAPAHTGLADAYLLSADYSDMDPAIALERAASSIERAFELDPDSADAWASLGLLESERRNAAAARAALEQAIQGNPNNAMAWMWLGNVLGSVGEPLAGLEALERGRAIEPLHPTLLGNIAFTLSDFGRQQEALEAARELIEMYPDNGVGQARSAVAAFREGRIDEAIRWSLAAWRVAPERVSNFSQISFHYLLLGAPECAQLWLDHVQTISSGVGFSTWMPSLLLQQRGDFEGMVAYWTDRAERYGLWTDDASLGDAQLRLGDYPAARESFERALRDGERVGITADTVGMAADYALVLRETGDAIAAQRLLSEALEIVENLKSQGLVFHRGPIEEQRARILAQQGRTSEALAALRRRTTPVTFFLKTDPTLAPLRDDLGYVDLLADREARLAEQRAALEADGLLAGPAELNERGWVSDR